MAPAKITLQCDQSLHVLSVEIGGDWQLSDKVPCVDEVCQQFSTNPDITKVIVNASQLSDWDSSLLSFLCHLARECQNKKITVQYDSFPEGVESLVALSLQEIGAEITPKASSQTFLVKAAERFFAARKSILILLDFLGEIICALGRLIAGKAYFRWNDFWIFVQRCGADALGLVSLISLLVGVILAFVGAMQLKLFGAQIYIADIVGIAMVRVMGAVMTGIIMSGRTGASFAAELGIMQANEEIDAFKTIGVNPVEFLVTPRLLALVVMMPLLTLYANFMGILGGFAISASMLNLNPVEYLNHTQVAVKINNLWVGLIHGIVFGIIIAVCGCLRGMQCERSSAGVGEATTSAVVTAITSIVVATAIITFICQILGV
ncbi:MAG TPA: ABC transporter permease [Candidatus Omnitrophota bacterium]|nr:ABC transporter permease [Candidatus Omnitrophota bacterium]